MNERKPAGVISPRLIVAIWAITLAACGGGGGGGPSGPPSTPIAVSDTNATPVAGESADAFLQVGNSSALVSSTQTVGGGSAPLPLSRVLSSSIKRLNAVSGTAQVTAVVTQSFCTVSGTFTINDNGTSVTISFNNCSDVVDEVVNGTIAISGIVGDPTSFSATVNVSLTISVSGEPNASFVGGFSLTFAEVSTTDTLTLSGSSLSLTSGSHSIAVTGFNIVNVIDTTTGDLDAWGTFTLASTRLNGSVTVSVNSGQELHVISGREHPSTGVLTATGSGGTKVRLTVLGDETAPANSQVQLEIDTGSGFGAPINKTWAELDA